MFHQKFRSDFKTIYALSTTYQKRGLSLPRYVDYALTFNSNLSFHHSIEEQMVFPALGARMPEFREGHEHKESHRKIHDGLEAYCEYLESVKQKPETYDASKLQKIMTDLGNVLFVHLDEEEESLGKDNMQKYWTLQEIAALPM